MNTRAGHWSDRPDASDTAYHAPIDVQHTPFQFSPADESTNGRGYVTLGRAFAGYLVLMAAVVAAVRYFIGG